MREQTPGEHCWKVQPFVLTIDGAITYVAGRTVHGSRFLESTAPVIMYSTSWCGYCHRLKSQMDREGIEFEVVDIEHHPEAAEVVAQSTTATTPCRRWSTPTAPRRPTRRSRT